MFLASGVDVGRAIASRSLENREECGKDSWQSGPAGEWGAWKQDAEGVDQAVRSQPGPLPQAHFRQPPSNLPAWRALWVLAKGGRLYANLLQPFCCLWVFIGKYCVSILLFFTGCANTRVEMRPWVGR